MVLGVCWGCDPAGAGNYRGSYQGVLEFEERVLGFEVGGRLASLTVARGDFVETGTALATIEDTVQKALRDARAAEVDTAIAQASLLRAGSRAEDIRATEAQLRAADANEHLLERTVAREKELATSGASTTVMLDDLEAKLSRARSERESLEQRLRTQRGGARVQELAAADARVAATRAVLAAEEQRLARFSFSTSEPGRVLDVHAKVGEIVAPGAPVVTVADTRKPMVDVFVPQMHLQGIRVGLAASVRVDSLGAAFAGHVDAIYRNTEFTPRFLFSERERPNLVVRVRVRVDDPQEQLHAGVPAFVRFSDAARP